MVSFLESLSIYAFRGGILLEICLSSRYYPSIRIKKVVELAVEKSPEHQMDIAKYIRERLIIRNDEMEAEITKRADSVFLWAVIVVTLLNKAYDEGRVESMQRTLEEIPGDLEEVVSTILDKDVADAAETVLMLQWVLLSQRPLQPLELFAAVVRVAPPTVESIQRRIGRSQKERLLSRFKSRVLAGKKRVPASAVHCEHSAAAGCRNARAEAARMTALPRQSATAIAAAVNGGTRRRSRWPNRHSRGARPALASASRALDQSGAWTISGSAAERNRSVGGHLSRNSMGTTISTSSSRSGGILGSGSARRNVSRAA